MAASTTHSDDDGIVGVNVTPLVDITLVLLIIFMVTAKMVVSQAIPFDLPHAASAGETQTVMVVAIDAQGHVQTDGRAIETDEALREAAKGALAKNGELRTVISASQAVSHGTVLHVVDELRRVGVTKIAFGAEKKRPGDGS
jgi:biopolymer transport protein ExbD